MDTVLSDHIRIDERSLALHEVVARKLMASPVLLNTARENLRRWRQGDGRFAPAFAEWDRILAGAVDDVAALLVERSARATRLRQSSPFAGILTEEERRAVYESYSTRTYHSRGESDFG